MLLVRNIGGRSVFGKFVLHAELHFVCRTVVRNLMLGRQTYALGWSPTLALVTILLYVYKTKWFENHSRNTVGED